MAVLVMADITSVLHILVFHQETHYSMISIGKDISPIKLIYYNLRFCGALNLEGRPWSVIYSVNEALMMIWLLLSAAIELVTGNGKLVDKMQSAHHITVLPHLIAKLFNCFYHQTEIRELLDKLDEMRTNAVEKQEGEIHISWADSLSKKCFIISASAYLSLISISPAFNILLYLFGLSKEPVLTLQIWVPIDYKSSMYNYVLATIYVAIVSWPTALCLHAYAILLTIFTVQLSCQLRILQDKFQDEHDFSKSTYNQHVTIIELFNKFNTIFAGQLYFEIMLSAFQPCGFGYCLIRSLKSSDPAALDFLFKLAFTFALPLMICGCGEELSSQFEKLHQKAYMSNWYMQSTALRKRLFLVMIKTCQPHYIHFKWLIIFNLTCFATVLQGTYSYMTMLINLDV